MRCDPIVRTSAKKGDQRMKKNNPHHRLAVDGHHTLRHCVRVRTKPFPHASSNDNGLSRSIDDAHGDLTDNAEEPPEKKKKKKNQSQDDRQVV